MRQVALLPFEQCPDAGHGLRDEALCLGLLSLRKAPCQPPSGAALIAFGQLGADEALALPGQCAGADRRLEEMEMLVGHPCSPGSANWIEPV